MEDPVFRQKYQKCKYRVKQWEKEFKKKHGRVPSKLDIRDSPSEIRNSYKMYYRLKTSLLEDTLLDVLDDDDDFDGSLISQESSFSQEIGDSMGRFGNGSILNESALAGRTSSMSSLLTEPIGRTSTAMDFEAEEQVQQNQNAWRGEKSRKKDPVPSGVSKDTPTDPPKPVGIKVTKLMSATSLIIPKRNPRKSMSRNSFGMSATDGSGSTTGGGSGTKFTLPDLETLLTAKSKELESSMKVEEKLSVPSLSEPMNQLDERWLNRRSGGEVETSLSNQSPTLPIAEQAKPTNYGLRNINLASIASSSSFGMSSLSVACKEPPVDIKPMDGIAVQNTAYDRTVQSDSDGVVENSEDESTKTSPGMMHIAKKRKIFTTINRSPVEKPIKEENISKPVGEPQAIQKDTEKNPQNEKENEKEPVQRQKRVVKKVTKSGKPKPTLRKVKEKPKSVVPRARSTRASAKVASYREILAEDNAAVLKPKQVRRSRSTGPVKQRKTPRVKGKPSPISPKLSPGSSKPSTSKGRKSKGVTQRQKISATSEAQSTGGEQEEPDEYVPEFGLDRLKSIPRLDIKELMKDTKLADTFIQGAGLGDPTGKPSTAEQSESAKETALRKKMAAGKLNENFVRVDLRKKVFVRGKKTMNYSRYKKSLWKAKKVAALSGPDMDMGGCDGGTLTCFLCGGTGHMARQCKNVKEDKLLPFDENAVEDSSFPTLEEAEAMALSKTAVVHSNRMENLPPVANLLWKEQPTGSSEPNDEQETTTNSHDELPEEEPPEATQEATNVVSKPAYIGHRIPEDFLKKSGLLEATVSRGAKGSFEPVYEQQPDGTLPETPPEVLETLQMFGHKSFRHGQERAVMRVLCGMSTLVTLSTGAGKSLCYQLPAYLYRRKRQCITLVISPLVSLMEDQVHGMPDFLNAHCLHTNQTPKVRDRTMTAIKAGEVDVLLISPEAVVAGEKSTGFGSLLRELPPIAFACIDEAHCVSQWSHNFRPSYLMICKVLKEKLGVRTILGLTATATVQTRQSIVSHLAIPDGLSGIISDIPLPDNLLLTVSRDANRDTALVELLLSERFSSLQSIIVYCTRRDDCERVATFVRTCFQDAARAAAEANTNKRRRMNYVAEPYHAGMPASRRRTIQNAFMSGELRIVVATIAFGMGINKADIRAIIHYNMPKNFESYVQEVGRAGRDGLLSHCHLFLDNRGNDRNELRRFIFANSIDRHVIRKLLQKIFVPCACAQIFKNPQLANDLQQEIQAINGIDWDAEFDDNTAVNEVQRKNNNQHLHPKGGKRLCPGHEICFSIESTVQQLDIPEENIATFLCYLELHEQKYIQALSPAYCMCKIMSYNGVRPLRMAAKECPPLAMAFALDLKRGISHATSTVIEFPVIDVAAAIGWDSGVVKYQLKNLEWTTENNVRKRSPLSVSFSNLGFRVRAPGDLTDDELDRTLDTLYERVTSQERTQLAQLQYISDALNSVSFNSIHPVCRVDCPSGPSEKLKKIVREYFITDISKEHVEIVPEPDDTTDERLIADIRTMICRYPENNFSGRTIARIFHGVQSPNYPALVWSRSNFWRAYTKTDFNRIVRLANAEIVRMKS
ncbi:AGAP005917-PA-like protein [Anopheles sinensis]|uniref:ATP-dependent DNA helicase Q4 n=1 Tax=Anopheles sinensis TaxID=74873 RepID=A0A084W2L6_ANOSI|nr:AGAP005917-PA-like protein [Anopheles sinensis]